MPKAVRVPHLAAIALAATLAACSGPTPTTYDLAAPRDVTAPRRSIQLVVAEPLAVQALASERIIVKDATGAVSFVGGAQWADQLPRLIQARLIQTFENARSLAAVGRPGDRVASDYQLNTDIRAFEIRPGTGEAVVEISAKLIQDQSGRVARSRIFTARVPGSASDGAAASAALDQALSTVLAEIVRWVG